MILENIVNRKRTALILAVTFLIYGIVGISGADNGTVIVAGVLPGGPYFDADSIEFSIDEDAAIGTTVGTMSAHNFKDLDKYVLSAESETFSIDSSTGELTTKTALDYNKQTSYSLVVEVQGHFTLVPLEGDPIEFHSTTDSINVTVEVEAVRSGLYFNEGSHINRSVAENSPKGTNIGEPITATSDSGNTLSYSVGIAKSWSDKGIAFDIDSSTGQLKTSSALDYETLSLEPAGLLAVTVIVTDGVNTALTAVTITVTDVNEADAAPAVSSAEIAQIIALLTMDKVIFNEIYNASNDTHDWLEFRNISDAAIDLTGWRFTLHAEVGGKTITFPAGASIPVGGVLLLVNTDPSAPDMPLADTAGGAVNYIVDETFNLPATDFALILQGADGGYEDCMGNYFPNRSLKPASAAPFTADVVWYRAKPALIGYQTEAWIESSYREGLGYDDDVPKEMRLGTPGYRHRLTGDLNNDGVVNILDLVLIASQFGQTDVPEADLNSDGTVDTEDLVIAANSFGATAAAPSAQTVHASQVAAWLRLAKVETQRISGLETPPTGDRFSYEQGVAQLEQLLATLIPKTSALLPNYPNPFNPETWIPYRLAKASEVVLRIYDARGSLVRQLDLGHQPVGSYQTRGRAAYWDGRNELGESVASGLYFYTLTAGDFSATRRMLILK